MKLETIAAHAGHSVDNASGAVAEPITLSVTCERNGDGLYSRGYFCSSKGTFNRIAREAAFASLEGGQIAVAFIPGVPPSQPFSARCAPATIPRTE